MEVDWRYSPEKMQLRRQCLNILLRTYGAHLKEDGTPEHSPQHIYECAHDWISQGNPQPEGIIQFFETNYYDEWQLETRDGEIHL